MAAKKKETAKPTKAVKEVVADTPVEQPVTKPAGKVAPNWRDPNYHPAEGDNSIDARMKRLTDEIRG